MIASQQTPFSPGVGDAYRRNHWDTVALATGVNRYTMFQTPISATKTIGETSMEFTGQFTNGVDFFADRLGFKLVPARAVVVATATLDAYNAFLAWAGQVVVTLNVVGKVLGQWHLTNWLNTINEGVEDAASNLAAIAAASAPAWYTLGSYSNSTSIPLRSQISFNIVIENADGTNATPAALNGYRLITILDGIEQKRK